MREQASIGARVCDPQHSRGCLTAAGHRPVLRWTLALAAAVTASAAPLSPEQELATFHLADPDLRVELVAAEPDVVSPVAIAFDARGRMFVAEMIDYPLGPEGGQIRYLEDQDGDGRF